MQKKSLARRPRGYICFIFKNLAVVWIECDRFPWLVGVVCSSLACFLFPPREEYVVSMLLVPVRARTCRDYRALACRACRARAGSCLSWLSCSCLSCSCRFVLVLVVVIALVLVALVFVVFVVLVLARGRVCRACRARAGSWLSWLPCS